MLYPPDFEKRVVEDARRWTDDIVECDQAEISVQWHGQAPIIRFAFGLPILGGRPALGVALITESRKNPLAPGRLLQGDELRRQVRSSVERYFHENGLQVSYKAVVSNAEI